MDETINLIAEKVYSEESAGVPPFPKKVFIKLLKFATSGMFLYNDKLYRQVHGVAMGSPLGPSLANFFLGHLEMNFFNNTGINPKLYLRYVDDIFAVFDKDVPCDNFLDYINKQHPNIKFTVEKTVNSLPFLNTEIHITGDNFESWVYRKDTNTSVVLNWEAICPITWKKGIIFGALYRAKIICSNRDLFIKEVEKLRNIFWKNGYSTSFFNRIYEAFEQKQMLDDVVDPVKEEVDMRYILKIPYVGGLSHDFKSKIVKLFYEELRIDIVPVFNTFKVSNYFTLKSRTPKLLMANVVYKFTCLCDTNLTYIGKTKRHLAVRSLEHLEFKSENPKSEVKVHLKSCQTCQNCSIDNFEVLKKCKNDHENKICEAMFIKSENPKLNKNLFNKGSFVTLKIYY